MSLNKHPILRESYGYLRQLSSIFFFITCSFRDRLPRRCATLCSMIVRVSHCESRKDPSF
jgi:hypothetical protein